MWSCVLGSLLIQKSESQKFGALCRDNVARRSVPTSLPGHSGKQGADNSITGCGQLLDMQRYFASTDCTNITVIEFLLVGNLDSVLTWCSFSYAFVTIHATVQAPLSISFPNFLETFRTPVFLLKSISTMFLEERWCGYYRN